MSETGNSTFRTTDLEVPARDGVGLAATLFEPALPREPKAAILLNGATAVRRGYYRKFARYLAEEGFAVLTFDYRGIGGSRPASLRGFEVRMRDWAQLDASGALDWLEERFSDRPLLLVGHSFGGQALGLMEGADRLAAVMFVAAQSGYWGHWRGLGRVRILVLWYLIIPLLTRLFGRLPAWAFGASEDLPAGVAREWARWGRHPRYLLGADGPDAGAEAAREEGPREESRSSRYAALRMPLRAVSLTDDTYAPESAVEALLGFYSGCALTRERVRPKDAGAQRIGHFDFFRETFRETLWWSASDWLERKAAS